MGQPIWISGLCRILIVAVIVAAAGRSTTAGDDDHLWAALREGEAFAIMRHALAPGVGDPGSFVLGDCSTQRNLSDAGRQQAIAIGERFRQNGISSAKVLSSAWCRCIETAELLRLGPVTKLPALNSFFARPERREAQTRALRQWLAGDTGRLPLVLVTHQVNISAFAGTYTSSGEIVVVTRQADGEFAILGKI